MLRNEVEQEIKSRGIPYVSVDEAKKALFASSRLAAFHFVVYAPTGSNWLLWVGERTPHARETMRAWADVFGDGFMVVFALDRARGIEYRAENDDRLNLDDLCRRPNPSPLPLAAETPSLEPADDFEPEPQPEPVGFSLLAESTSTQGLLF